MKNNIQNINILLIAGVAISFLALVFSVEYYWEISRIQVIFEEQDHGENMDSEKFMKSIITTSPEFKILISEIEYRENVISMLAESINKIIPRAKYIAKLEIILWFFATSIFSILLILKRKENN